MSLLGNRLLTRRRALIAGGAAVAAGAIGLRACGRAEAPVDEQGRVRLRFATDVAGYADWALEKILASPHFDWPAQRADDWRMAPADHITTRYEEKRLGDCEPVFFDFIRR